MVKKTSKRIRQGCKMWSHNLGENIQACGIFFPPTLPWLFNGIISYFILALCLVNFGIIISVIARLARFLLLALIIAIASKSSKSNM